MLSQPSGLLRSYMRHLGLAGVSPKSSSPRQKCGNILASAVLFKQPKLARTVDIVEEAD
jgi:hypothetical protein